MSFQISNGRMLRKAACLLVACGVAACAYLPTAGTPADGARFTHRFKLPPEQAARCFGRNAEEHSSALVSEVQREGDGAQTIVRVKNGVTYATARFRPAGSGAIGEIRLMVTTSGSRSDLANDLVRGC
ncbi:MAG: hypothetical protein ACXW2I_02320 [Burkholderiales bacterium]